MYPGTHDPHEIAGGAFMVVPALHVKQLSYGVHGKLAKIKVINSD